MGFTSRQALMSRARNTRSRPMTVGSKRALGLTVSVIGIAAIIFTDIPAQLGFGIITTLMMLFGMYIGIAYFSRSLKDAMWMTGIILVGFVVYNLIKVGL